MEAFLWMQTKATMFLLSSKRVDFYTKAAHMSGLCNFFMPGLPATIKLFLRRTLLQHTIMRHW